MKRMRIFLGALLLLGLLLPANGVFAQCISQASFPYEWVTAFSRDAHDSNAIVLDDNLILRYVCDPNAPEGDDPEIFEPADTACRVLLVSGKNIYMVDSLLFPYYRYYSAAFQVTGLYKADIKGERFVILDCYNGYQLGTFVQPLFIVLKEEQGNYALQSVYMITNTDGYADYVYNSLKMTCKKGKVRLNGSNLLLLRDPGWYTTEHVLTLQNTKIEGVPDRLPYDSLVRRLGACEERYTRSEDDSGTMISELLEYEIKGLAHGLSYLHCKDSCYLQDLCFTANPDSYLLYDGFRLDGRLTLKKCRKMFRIPNEQVAYGKSYAMGCPFLDDIHNGFVRLIRLCRDESTTLLFFDPATDRLLGVSMVEGWFW